MFLFGTESGFDVEGNDPICYHSVLDNVNGSQPLLQGLNQLVFEQRQQVELLPNCPDSDILRVDPLFSFQSLTEFRQEIERRGFDVSNLEKVFPDSGRIMYTEERFPFAIEMRIEKEQLSLRSEPELVPLLPPHVRLMFCDANQPGFCNPMYDSRELDSTLQPFETDWGALETDTFLSGADRWEYNPETTVLTGIAASPLVVLTRWARADWTEVGEGSNSSYHLSVNITFEVPTNMTSGEYNMIAHVVAPFSAASDTVLDRWDVAAPLLGGPVVLRQSPTIATVTDDCVGVVAISSLVFGLYALYCFGFVVWKRKHVVMKLAQAPFLATIAFGCLLILIFQFTVAPTHDWHCRSSYVLVSIPRTLVGAILISRIWRVHQTLSVACNIGRFKKSQKQGRMAWCAKLRCKIGVRLIKLLSFLASIPTWRKGRPSRTREPSLRRHVSEKEMICLVFMLTLPNLLAQIILVGVEDRKVILEIDADENEGRYICGNGGWAEGFADSYNTLLGAITLIVAWVSRDLPSAFNEKKQIFQVAGFSIVLAIVVGYISGDTDKPTTHPDALVGSIVASNIVWTMLVLILIVRPKIRRVKSGEKVVMSNLLAERSSERSQSGTDGTTFGIQTVSVTAPHITLKQDDPLPRRLELDLYRMRDLLQTLSNRVGEGRPLRLSHWDSLRQQVRVVHQYVDRVDLEWESDEEPTSGRNAPAPTDKAVDRIGNVSSEDIEMRSESVPVAPSAYEDSNAVAMGVGDQVSTVLDSDDKELGLVDSKDDEDAGSTNS